METKVVVDSSVFVNACLDETSSHISQAFMEIIPAKHIGMVVPEIVIFEVLHILKKNGGADLEEVIDFFYQSSTNEVLSLDQEILRSFLQNQKISKLKTSDAIVASIANMKNIPLISWDKKLLKTVGIAYTPEEWLAQNR